jgi:hypothetical protein
MKQVVSLAILGLLVASARTPARVESQPPAAVAASQDSSPRRCCYTNPRHSGTCEVTPAASETCEQVLEYLNNPNSQGKDYCGNTTIRGGWTIVACEPKK